MNCTAPVDTTGTSGNSGNEGTGVFRTSTRILEVGDFWEMPGVLHPVVVGTIALVAVFAYIRRSSNRTVAPLSIFDHILSIALGSTLAGIINGNSLVRGLLGVIVLFAFQRITSTLTVRFPKSLGRLFNKPSLIVVFRGEKLEGVMRRHRISDMDLFTALRMSSVWNLCEIEVMCIETNGAFSTYLKADYPKDYPPDMLLAVPGYRELCEKQEEDSEKERKRGTARTDSTGSGSDENADQVKEKNATQQDSKEVKVKSRRSRDLERQEENGGGGGGCDASSVHSSSSIANRAAQANADETHEDKT